VRNGWYLPEFTIYNREMIEKMQNERVVVLEQNIIPKDLGMGNSKDDEEEYEAQDKGKGK